MGGLLAIPHAKMLVVRMQAQASAFQEGANGMLSYTSAICHDAFMHVTPPASTVSARATKFPTRATQLPNGRDMCVTSPATHPRTAA